MARPADLLRESFVYNRFAMIDAYLVPEKTRVTAKGDGAPVELSGTQTRVFLATLKITEVVEQESIDLSIVGSTDGTAWEPKPVTVFPQLFYRGETPLLIDLSQHPEVKFVRAHWEVNRWGRGPESPMFEFQVLLKEVPPEFLKQTRTAAR